jgi:hypothetical protein
MNFLFTDGDSQTCDDFNSIIFDVYLSEFNGLETPQMHFEMAKDIIYKLD